MDPDDAQEALRVLAQAEAMHREWNDTQPDNVINIEPLPESLTDNNTETNAGDFASTTSEVHTGATVHVVNPIVMNDSSENQPRTLGTFRPIGTAMADNGDNVTIEGGELHSVETSNGEEVSIGVVKAEDEGAGDATSASGKRYRAGGSTALTPSLGAPPPTEAPAPAPANALHADKTCTVCGRILSSVESCNKHIANHSKTDFFMPTCDVCGWAFESNMQMKMHKKTHGSAGTKKPPAAELGGTTDALKVNFPFPKAPGPGKALEKDTTGGIKLTSLACLFCGRVLHTREALKDHQTNHCNDFNFMQCPDCEMCFETKEPLVKHRKQAHNYHGSSDGVLRLHDAEVTFPCVFCQRSFKTEGKMEEHTENHKKGVRMYKCNICSWDFEGPGDLKIHKRNKHKEAGTATSGSASGGFKLPCTQCGRLFNTEGAMQDHLENHYNGSKLYVCSDCGFAYENAGSMYGHRQDKHKKQTSSSPAPRKPKAKVEVRTCEVCKRVLANVTAKEAHVVNHANGISMTECETCGWGFEVEEEYAQHMRTGHKDEAEKKKRGRKPGGAEQGWKHQCDFCDRKFQSEMVKAVHMQNHLNGTPMTKCEHCKAQFEQEVELEFHQKTHKSGGGGGGGEKGSSHKKKPPKEEQETVCSQCDRQFYYEIQMKKHLDNHFNGMTLYKCPHCPWEFEKEGSLPNHIKSYHPFYADIPEFAPPGKKGRKSIGKKFHCVMCKRAFTSLLNYAQHLVHHEKMPYTCPYDDCGWTYDEYKLFLTHKEKAHGETSETRKYRLEEIAQKQSKEGGGELSKEDERLLKDTSSPDDSVSFALVCPRCRVDDFDQKKKLEVHASRCKVDYHCNLCQLEFKSLYEFEYHIYPEQMECEACKKRFGSECILQTHLMKVHFSEDMIDEQQKQQEILEEEAKKKAEEAAATKGKKTKTEPTATVVKESPKTSKAKPEPKEEEETPKAARKRGRPNSAKKQPETPTRMSSPRKAKAAPSSNAAKVEEKDATVSDEHLVSSTVDTPDGSTSTAPTAQKRKRTRSNDSNTVDSSEDQKKTDHKKMKTEEGGGDADTAGFVCDVEHCGGTFFKMSLYMAHVRHVHADISNITSDETCSVIMLKDARRTHPLQRGPASKRKEFTVLRVQCLQGACAEDGESYFTTKALYNKHAAEMHATGITTSKIPTPNGEAVKTVEKNVKNESEAVVQSTVSSSPGSNKTEEESVESGSDSEEEEDQPQKKKAKKDFLQSMISESSYTTLLKDLDMKTVKKNSRPGPASKKRGASPARKSPRGKKGDGD